MEKLELKHLAAYLPYELKGRVDKKSYLQNEKERIGTITQIDVECSDYDLVVTGENGYFLCYIEDFKPILRPLSDLTKEIEVNGEKFVPLDWFEEHEEIDYFADNIWIQYLFNYEKDDIIKLDLIPYGVMEKLFEWHFDVFGLIEKGLAIDFNTLNNEKNTIL